MKTVVPPSEALPFWPSTKHSERFLLPTFKFILWDYNSWWGLFRLVWNTWGANNFEKAIPALAIRTYSTCELATPTSQSFPTLHPPAVEELCLLYTHTHTYIHTHTHAHTTHARTHARAHTHTHTHTHTLNL